MKLEGLENNLMHKRYRKDETDRLNRKLEEIKTRKPLFERNDNILVLPIIHFAKLTRLNNQKRLD